jgi:peptidoglycan/LPS O-acetylase OafA/YrhL
VEPHSPRNTDSHRFIPGLESVRGLAALAVCLFHTGHIKLNETTIVPAHSSINALFNGHSAVVLFFVLSGFVLRLSLANKWSQPIPIVASGYLVARLFRLFPVIVATVLVRAAVRWICDGNPVSAGELLRNAALLGPCESKCLARSWSCSRF